MAPFILWGVFNALSKSLMSGTDTALIYDSLKTEKKEAHFKQVIGTYFALSPLGAAIGSVIGGHLASVSLSLPIVVTIIPASIALISIFFIEEPEYKKESHTIFKHMIKTSKLAIKNWQIIVLLLAAFLFHGLSEGVHRLNAIFFNFKSIPIVFFGYIAAINFALNSISSYSAHAISEKIGNKLILIISTTMLALTLFIATQTVGVISIAFLVSGAVFWSLRKPVVSHLLNLEVESGERATMNSIMNLTRGVGIAIFAPLVGYWADLYSINTAYKFSALVLLSVPIIYLFLKERN